LFPQQFSSQNRSPSSYYKNQPDLLDAFEDEGPEDRNLTQIVIFENKTKPIGFFNWFAVHPTAMNNSNTLINGDVKGWASNKAELAMQSLNSKFTAGFGSTNLGDISPNIRGAKCDYEGQV
jgi:neutral ceramidase